MSLPDLRVTLAVESAVTKLRESRLYVRQLDAGGFFGGSHVDASSGLRMVQNSFAVQMIGGFWSLNLLGVTIPVDSLEEAVGRILAEIQPGIDIPAPTRRGGGFHEY
jgi:hypothetical protein